jgi:ABC-type Zn uptake system ZnuABC Zn-binding protein ZnuA
VLVLSPIEGIDKEEHAAGIGYIDKMKQNIANLKEGLECR